MLFSYFGPFHSAAPGEARVAEPLKITHQGAAPRNADGAVLHPADIRKSLAFRRAPVQSIHRQATAFKHKTHPTQGKRTMKICTLGKGFERERLHPCHQESGKDLGFSPRGMVENRKILPSH
jgi:hypothetical protein